MPTVTPAFQFLEDSAAELFGPIRSMLYVGHRGDTHPWWRTTFAERLGGPDLSVLDIDKGNLGSAEGFAKELILADVRTHRIEGYGMVFWDEGPEHLPREESLGLLGVLAANNRHVLISCPWGYQPQGTGPSDYEFHHWGPMPADFESIGFKTAVFGTMFDGSGHGHGNLLAWI